MMFNSAASQRPQGQRGRRGQTLVAVLGAAALLALSASRVRAAEVDSPALPSPGTNLPLITIRAFLDEARSWGENAKVRLRGTITLSLADKTFFIQEGDAGVYVFHRPEQAFQRGDWVEVVGSPSLGGLAPTLHYCTAVLRGKAPVPDAPLLGENVGDLHMSLVRCRGILESRLMQGRMVTLKQEHGTQVIAAQVEAGQVSADLATGSLLELTGVLNLRRGPDKNSAGIWLLMRSPEDIRVLAGPPFWSLRRVAWILGLVVATLVVVLVWVWALRRQVRQQTALIEQRLEREAALRASEDRFAKVFRASPEPIMIVRQADQVILNVNPAFEHLLGFTAAEAVGRTSRDLNLWASPDARDAALLELTTKGSLANLECDIRTRSGDVLSCLASAETIEIRGERYWLSITRDITARKKAEEERRTLQTALAQARRIESLGTLAGGIAHDFNNILGAVLGNADLARLDLAPDHPARASIEEIRKASLRARDLVKRILSFSRQEPADRRVLHLAPILEEAVRLLRTLVPPGVQIETRFDPDCPPVLADPAQLHQLMMNLGTNGGHAMEERPGLLSIELQAFRVSPALAARWPSPHAGPGLYARLAVRDHGKGMDNVTRERIFDPFFTTKDPGKGTGLGLAVVQSIVRNHDGIISVLSDVGRGSTFEIYLPSSTELISDMSGTEAHGAAPRHGHGERILFVDDEESLVSVATRGLQRLGYEVIGFTSGRAAIEAVNRNPYRFDLAVTDLNMPGTSGLQVLEEIRRVRSDLPVVLSSGFITEEVRARALAAGARAIINKPESIDQIILAVDQLLGCRRNGS